MVHFPTENTHREAEGPVVGYSHPTGHEVVDAWIAGFLAAVGKQPWDDMHDYAAVRAMDYASTRRSVWTRFRDDDAEWPSYEEWPEGCENERDLLVWNRCDGFHIWWRSLGECPPGTHWARLPVRPTPTPSQAQDGYGAARSEAECTPKNEWRPAKEVLSEESISRFKSQKDSGNV